MAGTPAGAAKTAKTNKERYGEDFYRKIGRNGGKVTGVAKGFAANPELARAAGAIGSRKSRRRSKKSRIGASNEN